jgi:riboflavin biosynthesis pyrimidine reductase
MLLPRPDDTVDLAATYTDPRRQARRHRPWVLVNMIASADGSTAVAGLSGGLGGPGDKAVFGVIRRMADVILVGAGTVRAEEYGAPRRPGQRIAVVTRSGDLDWSSSLFTSGAGLVVMPEDGPEVPVPAVRAGQGSADVVGALSQLDASVVLAEGGPELNGALFAADVVDELCLTIAPLVVGGSAKRVTAGMPPGHHRFDLAHLLEDDGYLFCRYLRR